MDLLIYFGKVNLYWILLYTCYHLLLRNHTFFSWNRYYLVGSLGIAFLLPFIIYPETAPPLPVQYEFNAASFTLATAQTVKRPDFTWIQAVWIIYAAGFCVALYLFARNIFQLRHFLRSGELIELDDCKIVLIDSNNIGSFSFLSWIVINRSDYEHHFDAILRHEMVHTSQLHSVDILFAEILRTVFWFNPVLTFYKRAFQEVHEFLADEQAPNREHYAKFLVSYALNAPVASLTNHFFKPSQIKTRIQMIYKSRSSKWLLSTYALAALFIGGTALFMAGCEQNVENRSAEPSKKEVVEKPNVKVDGPVFTVVEKQPEFPGGVKEMYNFLAENIKYPEEAVKAGAEGRVFLSFIVTTEGEIADVKILKGLGYGFDEEALRVLSKFPKWQPGSQDGKPVNVKFNLPINFQLEEDEPSAAERIKDKHKPGMVLLDGKEITEQELVKLTSSDIESVAIFRDNAAIEKYGDKGKKGVMEITSTNRQSASSIQPPKPALYKPESPAKMNVNATKFSSSMPLVFIDGEKQTVRGQAALSHINPDKIQSISVLKDQNATSVYGEEGRDGVILVQTKK
jgi:TonB family protein